MRDNFIVSIFSFDSINYFLIEIRIAVNKAQSQKHLKFSIISKKLKIKSIDRLQNMD